MSRVFRDDFAAGNGPVTRNAGGAGAAPPDIRGLLDTLVEWHVDCRPGRTGVSVAIAVREVLHTPMVAMRLAHRLLQLAEDGVPFLLSLDDLGEGDEAFAMLHDFCLMLASVLETGGRIPAPPALLLHSGALPAEAFVDLSAPLGDGDRYLVLDESLFLDASSGALRHWRSLWQAQVAGRGPWPVYAAAVRSCCPLHSDEPATALLPSGGLRVPAGSAWLPLRLSLPGFADGLGVIDWGRLRHGISVILDAADNLLDLLDWPGAAERDDAWLNRRLAIRLEGLGTLVSRRGPGTARLDTLRSLDRDLSRLVLLLHSGSRRLARERGPTPSLVQTDPVDGWPDGELRNGWSRQWQQALRLSATRHRNLVAMSPWSLVDGALPLAASEDLLPVLRHAECVPFQGRAGEFPSFEAFRAFHCRSWAVLRGICGSGPIAVLP
jgi:hypothetical protein